MAITEQQLNRKIITLLNQGMLSYTNHLKENTEMKIDIRNDSGTYILQIIEKAPGQPPTLLYISRGKSEKECLKKLMYELVGTYATVVKQYRQQKFNEDNKKGTTDNE